MDLDDEEYKATRRLNGLDKSIIDKLKEFKAADDSAKEMEETIKEAIRIIQEQQITISGLQEQLQEKDKIIIEMAKYIREPYQLYLFKGRMTKLQAIIEYFTKKAREV